MPLSSPALALLHISIVLLLCATASGSTKTLQDDLDDDIDRSPGGNNVLQLVIQTFVDGLLQDLQREGWHELPDAVIVLIQSKMKNLHRHIGHHPALTDKRLWVGPEQPAFNPFYASDMQDSRGNAVTSTLSINAVSRKTRKSDRSVKPRRNAFLAEESCRTDRKWELINHTFNNNKQPVEIVHLENYLQFVYVYRCAVESVPCLGISSLYNSECEMRLGWMNMYHRLVEEPNSTPDWGYVAVPHHCGCKITPKFPLQPKNDN